MYHAVILDFGSIIQNVLHEVRAFSQNYSQEKLNLSPLKVYFLSGYHCAEVILRTTMDTFGREPNPAAVRCASAFGGGVGGTTEELCGAFTGGVMALGYLLGRDNPGESLSDCGALVKEFKLQFSMELGTLNCATILGRFENHEKARMECVRLTARAAQILADLLVKAEVGRGISLSHYLSQPRSKVKLGCCPFSTSGCEGQA
jgi:C_GCAxxG_C_C family probable redox protein